MTAENPPPSEEREGGRFRRRALFVVEVNSSVVVQRESTETHTLLGVIG